MKINKEIEKLVNYASENMGNDVLLSQTVDDILGIINQERFKGYLKGREEGINMFNKIKGKRIAVI